MSIEDNCKVMRQVQAENRRRLDARLERQLSKRSDALGDLCRRGVAARAATRAARQEHRLSAERDGRTWRAVCACGWHGKATGARWYAERDADREYDHIFRPLTDGPITHSPLAVSVKGAA